MSLPRFPVLAGASWSLACAVRQPLETALVLVSTTGLIAVQALVIGFLERADVLPRPAMAALFIVSALLVPMVTIPAWMRVLVQKPLPAGIPLRLGRREFQVVWAHVLVGVALVAAVVPASLAWTFAGYSAGLAAGSGSAPGSLTALLPMLVLAASIILGLTISVRFGAAPALTLVRGRVVFDEAWTASKRIWPGVALAVILAAASVFVAGAIIRWATGLDLLSTAQEIALDSDSPLWVLNTLVKAVLEVLAAFIMAGPFAFLALQYEAGRNEGAHASGDTAREQTHV